MKFFHSAPAPDARIFRRAGILIFGATLFLGAFFSTCSAAADAASSLEFFEKRIRPVLVAECYECHAGTKQKGGLRLDHRDALRKGGDTGPGIVPGNPDQSLLLRALTHADPELKMPKKGAKLDDRIIADFAAWIKAGAPDPREHPPATAPATAAAWSDILALRRQWWSFQPVTQSAVPTPKNTAWSTNAIDCFLLAEMEKHGLTPAPDADPRTLIRRLSFALTGLPPKPGDVETFVRNFSPSLHPSVPPSPALSQLVDSLLSSPSFGEYWARHWMDLVRYAETHGSEGDPEIRDIWRYRDYLIRAFNADVPADQLIREHLAGDLLAHPRRNDAENINESILGLAHLRLVEHGFQPVDTLDDQVKAVENQIDVLGKAFQGLTLACARCHDHKFDAISQRDYYALYGVLASSRPAQVTIDTPEFLARHRPELAALKRRIREELAAAWTAAAPELTARLTKGSAADPDLARLHQRVADLEKQIAEIDARARAAALTQKKFSDPPPQTPDPRPQTLAAPFARWSFDTDTRDQIGALHGEFLGNARLRNGRLILDGKDAHLRSAPLGRELREKTLEAWVALDNLTQTGGGVLTVETDTGAVFDSITFAEKGAQLWLAGSNNHRRSRAIAGPTETAKPGELIHVAIAYRADGSIALYRNGQPYGPAYTPGDGLVTFPKTARVLIGRRHTGGGKAFLAGEIDEARLYDRALTTAEIAASFQAGPIGLTSKELAAALTPEQRTQRAALAVQLTKASAELAARSPDSKPGAASPLATALTDARTNPANPLHAWTRLSQLDGAAFAKAWTELTTQHRESLTAARAHNAQFTGGWNLASSDSEKWFRDGIGLARGAHHARPPSSDAYAPSDPPGTFSLEPEGDRLLTGLLPAGVATHLLSQKHNGLFTSPRFKITTDSISVRAAGNKGAAVRVIVDNYPLPSNPIFPKAELKNDEPAWVRLDTAYRKGTWAYLEFGTADDLTRRLGRGPDAAGRSWFAATQVVFHDKEAPRDEPLAPELLFAGAPPQSPADLAARYERILRESVAAWRGARLTEPQRAFLDFFVRRSLLPVSLKALPAAAPLVTEYRRLEAEIPNPRRVPGVIEGTAYDAPLMVRGDHLKPAAAVPRGYLEALGTKSFADAKDSVALRSGRLELAEAIASPRNPFTARVLVNRVWQHLFGRGLVATVDNFGRLGERPTHPELLDFLAARFVAEGWSFKKLIRELVLSRAWQLSSEAPPAARELDAANQWLARFPVRRLEAESIRDALLVVAGSLDPTQFGPPLAGNNAPRRSVYLAVRRNNLNPFLETFDAPKPFTTLGRRDTTNVPGQSLALLNDPFVIDLARAWARELIRQSATATASAETATDARVKSMFAAAFARPPSASELAKSRAYLADLARDASVPAAELATSERVWQDFAQSLFNLKEFIYVR
ncbi:hypothetical protein LBMAG56_12530 [Verrucomicrobiota bacterium]|nr:hypothetical protein LBMAG56_12530 [Verrucomicrobiota bacterium]